MGVMRSGKLGKLLISIVIHEQGKLVSPLLSDLASVDFSEWTEVRIILTINVPEEEQFLTPFTDLVIIRNVRPLGYGANHNQAFASWESDFFLVLNPDIRLGNFEIFSLASRMGARTLVCAPVVRSSRGSIEDSARRFPTSLGMLQRVLLKKHASEYVVQPGQKDIVFIDWLAGMFMLFRSSQYRKLQGFDTMFFMYLEDADICRRGHEMELKVEYHTQGSVVHDARRRSLKDRNHFFWHLRSLMRYLFL